MVRLLREAAEQGRPFDGLMGFSQVRHCCGHVHVGAATSHVSATVGRDEVLRHVSLDRCLQPPLTGMSLPSLPFRSRRAAMPSTVVAL